MPEVVFIVATWVVFFVSCAFLGWLCDFAAASVRARKPAGGGFLACPLAPAQGVCGVLAALIPGRYGYAIWLCMACAGALLILTALRTVAGHIAEAAYGVHIWRTDRRFILPGVMTYPALPLYRELYVLISAAPFASQTGWQQAGWQQAGWLKKIWPQTMWTQAQGDRSVYMAVILLLCALAVLLIICLAFDLRAKLRSMRHFANAMDDLEDKGVVLYECCIKRQEEYDIKLGEYEDRAVACRQEWRRSMEEVSAKLREGGDTDAQRRHSEVEALNHGLQQALRSLKEEMMAVSVCKSAIQEEFYAQYDMVILESAKAAEADGRLRSYRRILNAFPYMTSSGRGRPEQTEASRGIEYPQITQYMWRQYRAQLSTPGI